MPPLDTQPDWPRDLARMEAVASGEPMTVIGNLLPLLRPLGADGRRLLAQVRIGTALDCIAAGDVAAVRALLVDALDLLGAGEGGGR